MINTLKFLAQMEVNAARAMERIQGSSNAWDYLYSDTINDLDSMCTEVDHARNAVARNFVMFSLYKGEINTFPIRSAHSRLVSLVQRSMYMKFADLDTVSDEQRGEMILMRFLSMCGRDDVNFPDLYFPQLASALNAPVKDFDSAMAAAIFACFTRDTDSFARVADLTCGFETVVTAHATASLPLIDLSWLLPLLSDKTRTISKDAMETVAFLRKASYNDMIRTINSLLDSRK